jgi:hypothetical protein
MQNNVMQNMKIIVHTITAGGVLRGATAFICNKCFFLKYRKRAQLIILFTIYICWITTLPIFYHLKIEIEKGKEYKKAYQNYYLSKQQYHTENSWYKQVPTARL